ncbi:uncharacterized protein LOC106089317 [Stomoxys calcitrans]|uniref:uncharacterized protein LOC106089317 n=1 Tax=Stomoxys calcitrans TaxID=35570 RepID=UPI0027E3AD2B|nr:uncharacterized protein LOC106089317 [Stomoxys calcitrans]
MTMEWTRDKTLALIQEYRKRRGLWDMTHEDYRKKDVKHKLLVEVSESLGGNTSIMEIEKKFHTLRTQYHREISRMKRKEPYNSKWFGFHRLQFLSSPRACRANKGGRIKAEITEDGTVTTKYIIREAIPTHHDTSVGSANENEEFVTVQRRPTTITYEALPTGNATSTSSSRSQELEKLIEETTKDVEEIEDSKPKMTIKELSIPIEHQHHGGDNYTNTGSGDLQITNVESEHEDIHHIEDDSENMDTINIHTASDEEITYHQTTNSGVVSSGNNSATTTTVHTIPARIIKIHRRDTHHDQNEYYEQQHHIPQHHHHSGVPTTHHIQTVSPGGATKRIYYDASGHHHTATILTASAQQTHQQSPSGMTILNTSTSPQSSKIHLRNSLNSTIQTLESSTPMAPSTPSVQVSNAAMLSTSTTNNTTLNPRDEYVTYGEYVVSEMRNITNREILISLKHKINTALFEANMQQLQK